MKVIRWSIVGIAIAGLGACVTLGDFSSDDPGFVEAPGAFEGRFLALSDADMAGTAYADGLLEPFEGARDELILFDQGASVAAIAASNSVISWPAVVDASPDGRFAYVVETRKPRPDGVDQMESVYEDFAAGTMVQAFAIGEAELTALGAPVEVGKAPQSVEVSRDGRFLVIATETEGAELVILPVMDDGTLGDPRLIALNPPYQPSDRERRVRNVHISSDGAWLAANVANLRVQFYRLSYDGVGLPDGVEAVGTPVLPGVRLAVGKWSRDNRHFLITDVNSYESSFAMLTQRGGQVHSIAAPGEFGEDPVVVSSVRVGRFAEGLEVSDDGTRVASIAMGRTYLPEWAFLSNWPHRRTYSLSLLGFDPDTGALSMLDEIRTAGVLPEDVLFDESGQNLAVATFHRRKGPDRYRGFIDYFTIEEGDRLTAQGRTQAVMRGPHDLVRLP